MSGGRSGRASARRSTLQALTDIRKTLDNMRGWWMVTGRVYVPPAQRPEDDPNAWSRERRPEEYPEAQVRYWGGTIAGIDKMIKDLEKIRESCLEEYNKTKE